MKTASLLLVVLVSLSPSPARASDYWRTLECAWQQERPGIDAAVASSNALLRYRCDDQIFAATRQRFAWIDQQSLAGYNRGLVRSGSRSAWTVPGAR